jgi:hypothetical protein
LSSSGPLTQFLASVEREVETYAEARTMRRRNGVSSTPEARNRKEELEAALVDIVKGLDERRLSDKARGELIYRTTRCLKILKDPAPTKPARTRDTSVGDQDDSDWDRTSVRAVSGGLPGLGKRS